MNNQDRSFLGTGWSFPPQFDNDSHTIKLVCEEDDIRQSLSILLSTTPGERVMHPTFGCNLSQVIFDNISQTTIAEIKDTIKRSILFFEPRISLERINIDTSELQYLEGILHIELVYLIRRTNTRSNMVYPFYLIEGTNL